VSVDGCTFCIDAGADFDWCRVCGRGQPQPAEPETYASPLQEAVRKARGDLTGAEVVQAILATHPPGCNCGKHAAPNEQEGEQ